MKLERLHLKAFGAFTDRELDFTGNGRGLHVIHGPNEAGKSTTLRAITQLLYGMPHLTDDDFLHNKKDLRIGATVSNDRDTLAFIRRKGNKDTLLAEDGKTPLADSVLAPFLGSVDLDAFRNLFGLTHVQLVEGGRALVQGQGDVGQALFSAASGISHLRELLQRLESDAGELFKPTGTKPRINNALARLAEARKAAKAAALPSKDWQALHTAMQEAEARRAELQQALAETQREKSRLDRVRQALPLVSQRAALIEALAPLAKAPVLPEDFTDRRTKSEQAARDARMALELAVKALAQQRGALAHINANDALLARADQIEELHQRQAVNQKALTDLDRNLRPREERLREEAEQTLHHLRPNWTLDQAEELRLSPGQKQRLNELDKRGESCRYTLESVAANLDKSHQQRERARAELTELGQAADTAAVERALKRAQKGASSEAELAELRERTGALEHEIETGIARLGGWSGTAESMEKLPVPAPEVIEQYRIDLGEARQALAQADRVARELGEERDRAERELAAYQRLHHAPSLEALDDTRLRRLEGWQLARSAWEKGVPPAEVSEEEALRFVALASEQAPEVHDLADAVAHLTEAADALADRLRNEADQVARRAQLESEIEGLRARCERQEEARATAATHQETLESDWCALWRSSEITPRPPAEMAAWCKQFDTVLARIAEWRDTQGRAARRAAELRQYRDELAGALQSAQGDEAAPESLNGLVDHAEIWVARQLALLNRRGLLEKTLEEHERDLPALKSALERAREEESHWREMWEEMMARIGAPATASGVEAHAIVAAIEEILAKSREASDLRQRMDFIHGDDADFRREVRALAETVGLANGGDEGATAMALFQALNENRKAETTRNALLKGLGEEEARERDAQAELARAEAELAALCAEAGVADPADLPRAERDGAERRKLAERLEEKEENLFRLFPGQRLEAISEAVLAEDAEAIEPALEALGQQIEDLDDERLALQESIGELKTKLGQMNGGSDAADAATEVQGMLASIARDAEEYARLRLAALALNRAIEAYRTANQEPLLARAGEIFRVLTLGSFDALRADVDDKGSYVLFGVRAASGQLVGVEGMSEGTADQLFLALRIASLERHLDRYEPIPFVLDDILVNFDDQRAAATLRVLADLSERTQVIYFTHHQHLVALARAEVSKKKLFVHELGAVEQRS